MESSGGLSVGGNGSGNVAEWGGDGPYLLGYGLVRLAPRLPSSL